LIGQVTQPAIRKTKDQIHWDYGKLHKTLLSRAMAQAEKIKADVPDAIRKNTYSYRDPDDKERKSTAAILK